MENKRTSSFEEILEKDGCLIYTNKGISMLPLLRQGKDLMVIQRKTDEPCKKYDAVLFKRADGAYVLHRILKVLPHGYWIVGDNCYHGETVQESQILGILSAVKRGEKEISVTEPGYRMYVHLWCDFYPLRFFLLWAWSLAPRAWRHMKKKIKTTHP